MQIKKIIQSFNPRRRKDRKALANLGRLANESYRELCNPDNKTEYQQRAGQFRDRVKATILDQRFLSVSKPIQKESLLSLLNDEAFNFVEPLIFEFTRALDGIYTPEELKTFCEQIKEPGGLYKTFRSGMVEIDGTKKLPQIILFLRSTGSPYLEALAEILHSLRLIDADTNPIEDRATKTGFKVIAGGKKGGAITREQRDTERKKENCYQLYDKMKKEEHHLKSEPKIKQEIAKMMHCSAKTINRYLQDRDKTDK